MTRIVKRLLKTAFPLFEPISESFQIASIRGALSEQGLAELADRLRALVPDLNEQYTTYSAGSGAMEARTRGLQAFQMRLALAAVDLVLSGRAPQAEAFTVVDVGDSAGTHLIYLDALLKRDERLRRLRVESISVNLDPVAVAKIRAKGLRAELCPAEKLHEKSIFADLFLSFETLEHLRDPVSFLDSMSKEARCPWFAVTVPLVRASRVGLQYIRFAQRRPVAPENVHLFELSPEDWKLIFKHAGWSVVREEVYLQYPKWSPLRALAPLWRKFDFEGFYGVVLKRDRSWADLYGDGASAPTA